MSLVTDNEEILNQKDIEWSSKFISGTEPDPISNQSKLPVEKQEESQQPRKTQVNSSIHKVGRVDFGKKKFQLLRTPCNCPLSNRELVVNQIELYFTHRIDLSCVRSYSRFINVQFADYITRILNCYVNLMWYVIKLECETVTFSTEDSERNKCMQKFVLN